GDERLAVAVALGLRVQAYLASVADPEHEPIGWDELHRDLVAWAGGHGAPSKDADVLARAKAERGPSGENAGGASWLLRAFISKTTTLIPALAERPRWAPRFIGDPNNPLHVAEHLYRTNKRLTLAELPGQDPGPLFAAGWCEDAPDRVAWAERLDVRG